jgi:hypothetical protein
VRIVVMLAAAAAVLLVPAAAPAHHSNAKDHQEMAQAKKSVKKKTAPKAKAKKDEYMRAVPSR